MKNVLLDCNYISHRSRFTTGPLSYKGKPTGVIYGFFSQLFNITSDLRPDRIIFCWDSKKSKRKHKYPFYKQNRNIGEIPQELLDAFQQFDLLRQEILPRIGFKNIFMHVGYESDDLFAVIVKEYRDDHIIVSSDEDLYQLLTRASMYNPEKKKYTTQESFMEEYKIPPVHWVDVKKIAGCTSDNVPGVHGVGNKTVIKYLLGELDPKSKKYQSIVSAEAKEIYERNAWLVELPLIGTKCPELTNDDKFDMMEFKKICNEYGFESFKMDQRVEDFAVLINNTIPY